jgi:hypothetical protein
VSAQTNGPVCSIGVLSRKKHTHKHNRCWGTAAAEGESGRRHSGVLGEAALSAYTHSRD